MNTVNGHSRPFAVLAALALSAPLATTLPTSPAAAAPTGPVAPLVRLGTWQGQQVSRASAHGANQLWLGAGRGSVHWGLPGGTVWHWALQGNRVDVWYQTGAGLRHQVVDLATRRSTGSMLASGGVISSGAPGFWARTPEGERPQDQLYSWTGVLRRTVDDYSYRGRGRLTGFTAANAVTREYGMTPTQVRLQPLDGRAARSWELGAIVMSASVDAAGVTARYSDVDGATHTCRVYWSKSTCPGAHLA